jgi:PhzF family phenazine biosynthesis protein
MKIPIFQVDAFASESFSGNPAAVCLLDDWLVDSVLQSIAQENNLSETAFLVPHGEGFKLRWFTPVTEVALCGHATLASALVVFDSLSWPADSITFQTRKSGDLVVTKRNGLLEMDFPATESIPLPAPAGLEEAMGIEASEVFQAGEDLMLRLADEDQIRALNPKMHRLFELDFRGIIATSDSDHCDFVSRFFAPRSGVAEDPVTGSAHCALVPYWSQLLGKSELHARQISQRGGELFCQNRGERVRIAGNAVLYLHGEIFVAAG